MNGDNTPASSTLFLDGVGEVELTLSDQALSWKPVATPDPVELDCCLHAQLQPESETEIKFSNIYAVEPIEQGLIRNVISNARVFFSRASYEMYCFVVHGFHKSKTRNPCWVLSAYTFGHPDFQACQAWVEKIGASINMQLSRPKNLMVFVHPLCGKGNGLGIWESVAPLFAQAKVKTKVIVTQRAGHAFETVASSTDRELAGFDGIIAVGGDGLFSEILNGLLSSRHKTPLPPAPPQEHSDGNVLSKKNKGDEHNNENTSQSNDLSHSLSKTPCKDDVNEPLLFNTETVYVDASGTDQEPLLNFPNSWFRLGIIPAGSTDAIVISTTGLRDPVTSALQIITGEKIPLDIALVVRWKTSPSSVDSPSVRYAASFVGYGFYGDVVKESEKYRWMGPKRYDFSGTKVFLEHRSYEAEVAFIKADKVSSVNRSSKNSGIQPVDLSDEGANKSVCQKGCAVCNDMEHSGCFPVNIPIPDFHAENSQWSISQGRYLSVGAAVISCRNVRAPDGLVADAHLADGLLDLILIKDCPRAFYLWHLMQLSKKGSNPFNFRFVEHHKTPVFTFAAPDNGSIWNVDGELLQACQVSVQACRGLINLFASGPII